MFVTHHERAEVVHFVFLRELIENFLACLQQIFKLLEFLRFSVKCGHCRCEGFGQFRDSVDVVLEVSSVAASRQLLKGQQNQVCFNCRMGVLTAELWLICGARILLLSRRNLRGAVGNLFLNSCHHVMCLLLV